MVHSYRLSVFFFFRSGSIFQVMATLFQIMGVLLPRSQALSEAGNKPENEARVCFFPGHGHTFS